MPRKKIRLPNLVLAPEVPEELAAVYRLHLDPRGQRVRKFGAILSPRLSSRSETDLWEALQVLPSAIVGRQFYNPGGPHESIILMGLPQIRLARLKIPNVITEIKLLEIFSARRRWLQGRA
jgi:hypothetical protein